MTRLAARWVVLLAALAGCATGGQAPLQASRRDKAQPVQKEQGDELPEEKLPITSKAPVTIEDGTLALRYELPAIEDGWQSPREGRGSRRGGNIQVEVGSFPLAREATAAACRDTARAKLGSDKPQPQGKPENTLREQAIGDWPTATWSFTRGAEDSAVRSRWAFYPRGSDCLLLEVTGPKDSRFADLAFQTAARTFKPLPLSPERQREIDLIAGMSFLERRDPASALERFEVLTAREPNFAKAHFGALMAGFELGQQSYGRTLPHGLAALRAERDLSAEQRQLALRAVGVMQLAEGQVKGAVQTLSELVVRVPDLAEGQYNYACALARLGDKNAALDHLVLAMRLDGDLVKHAKDDPDLSGLRSDERFQKLLREPPKPADAARRHLLRNKVDEE